MQTFFSPFFNSVLSFRYPVAPAHKHGAWAPPKMLTSMFQPVSFLGGVRKRLGSVAVPTEVENITVCRAPDTLPSSVRLSQVLFLVSELEKWL
jgi:hypothetical protein